MNQKELINFISQLDAILPALIKNFHFSHIPKILKPNITGKQYQVLDILSKKGKCMIGELSKYCNVARSTMTELIDRMANKNLVRRLKDIKDNRIVRIDLTNVGSDIVRRINAKRVEYVQNILNKLDKSHRGALINALREVFRIIKEQKI